MLFEEVRIANSDEEVFAGAINATNWKLSSFAGLLRMGVLSFEEANCLMGHPGKAQTVWVWLVRYIKAMRTKEGNLSLSEQDMQLVQQNIIGGRRATSTILMLLRTQLP